jgi:hypothetical protein
MMMNRFTTRLCIGALAAATAMSLACGKKGSTKETSGMTFDFHYETQRDASHYTKINGRATSQNGKRKIISYAIDTCDGSYRMVSTVAPGQQYVDHNDNGVVDPTRVDILCNNGKTEAQTAIEQRNGRVDVFNVFGCQDKSTDDYKSRLEAIEQLVKDGSIKELKK